MGYYPTGHCKQCGKKFNKKVERQRYCNNKCYRLFWKKYIPDREDRVCSECGRFVEKYQRKKCITCQQKRQINPQKLNVIREYQSLLENADKLNMTGFIKLQVLAEMLGRDIEEWVNTIPNLGAFQAQLANDRRMFDDGKLMKEHPEEFKACVHFWERQRGNYLCCRKCGRVEASR